MPRLLALFAKANFTSTTYTRTRNGRREVVRARRNYTRNKNTPLGRIGITRVSSRVPTTQEGRMRSAQVAYEAGEPGLLEKWGIIPNRRDAKFSSTYTRTRKGRREVVRKSRNRLNMERGRVSARVSVPTGDGEVYGLGVASVRRDGRNIQEKFQPSLSDRGVGLRTQGNVGNYQVKTRGYAGYNPDDS